MWKDKIMEGYYIAPIGEIEETDKLIRWLKREMAGFTYPRVMEEVVKRYRGNKVTFINSLELVDCYKSGKQIKAFYIDLI